MRTLPAAVDDSAMHFTTICVSAGHRGLEVERSPEDLIRVTDAKIAPIARRDNRSLR